MAEKDIISKDVLQYLAADIANILLHLDVDKNSVELLQTEQQRIEARRADMVARMRKRVSGESFILHVEIQNANDSTMPVRMLRYVSDILMSHPTESIYQCLVYIGKNRLTMPNSLNLPDFTYQYRILDMHTVDCSLLLAQDTPEALVLAILCDFKERPVQDVVNYIVTRLRELTGENAQRFRNYYEMLETLADNRDLQANLDEAIKMLTQVDITRFSTYRAGVMQTRAEFEPLLAEKELALQREREEKQKVQEKQQALLEGVKQLIALNTLSHQAIADLFKLSLEDVETIANEMQPKTH